MYNSVTMKVLYGNAAPDTTGGLLSSRSKADERNAGVEYLASVNNLLAPYGGMRPPQR